MSRDEILRYCQETLTVEQRRSADVEAVRSQVGVIKFIFHVVFDLWSPDVRQKVERNLVDGNFDADIYTKLVYYHLNVKEHLEYVRKHIKCVFTAYQKLHPFFLPFKEKAGFSSTEEDPTEEQMKKHDLSKFTLTEMVPYALKWHRAPGLADEELPDDLWKSGLDNHYCHNEHHPEFFQPDTPMPWRYLLEAIYDMAGIELDKKLKGILPSPPQKNLVQLLQFDDKYLTRFDRTGQKELVNELLSWTRDSIQTVVQS